jgi:hypothetical protein
VHHFFELCKHSLVRIRWPNLNAGVTAPVTCPQKFDVEPNIHGRRLQSFSRRRQTPQPPKAHTQKERASYDPYEAKHHATVAQDMTSQQNGANYGGNRTAAKPSSSQHIHLIHERDGSHIIPSMRLFRVSGHRAQYSHSLVLGDVHRLNYRHGQLGH